MNDIETNRLVLRLVPLAGLAATAAKDVEACHRLIGRNLHKDWFEDAWVSGLRLDQWKEDHDYAPWSIRAIVLKKTGEVVGNINCHDKPIAFEHRGVIAPCIEIGYSIFPPWRRQGLATEAITGLAAFAALRGVLFIRLSIAPGNAASLRLAMNFGADRIGSQIDEIDGPEDIYLFETRRYPGRL